MISILQKNYIRLSFILIISILSGCTKQGYPDFIENTIMERTPEFREKFDTIVIIPRLGCNSCTYEADKYYRKHTNSERTLFIFTNLQSKKLLMIEAGTNIEHKRNVLVDYKNSFWSHKYKECEYPTILFTDIDGYLNYEYLLSGERLMELE
jgi:lipoprotein